MDFYFLKKLAEILEFFAAIFIVMLAFYSWGQRLHNTEHGLKMKAITEKMDLFQNRLAGRAYKDMTRSVNQIDKMNSRVGGFMFFLVNFVEITLETWFCLCQVL
ncbi:MAG: hypothetical protein ACTMIA_11930 [Vibrio sp.]